MDFAFTEDQEKLRTEVRDFLEKECPKSLVREMEEKENGYSPELWRKMAELGWMGLLFPKQYGGSGMSFLDLTVLLEEMGMALVPSPFVSTVVLCGLAILYAGTDMQKRKFLPRIIKGDIVLSLALTEPIANYDAAGIAVKATHEKDNFVITGTKLFVPYAHIADYLLCVVRTKDSEKKGDGITLFLADAKSPGISHTLLKSIASDKQCDVSFDTVRVMPNAILGELDHGWEVVVKILEYATVAQCAFLVGGAQKVLEMTTSYAKERVQFGRPIGSFQAIQHKCANMLVDLEGAKCLTHEAAWRLSEGLPCTVEASAAKAWVSQAYKRIYTDGHQIQGGVSVIMDHDMQLYSRRGRAAEPIFGDANFHREKVARQLGL